MKLLGSGAARCCNTEPTTSPPAVSTSAASSSMLSSVERSPSSMLPAESPQSAARSFFLVVSFNLIPHEKS